MNEIVATKELQVRPILPRFFTAGDRAVIGGDRAQLCWQGRRQRRASSAMK
jgi:hypothetical protein